MLNLEALGEAEKAVAQFAEKESINFKHSLYQKDLHKTTISFDIRKKRQIHSCKLDLDKNIFILITYLQECYEYFLQQNTKSYKNLPKLLI